MRSFPSVSVVAVALLAAGAAAAPAVFPDGPPPGRTGGFGEPTCQTCHADASLNVAGEGLTIDSLPRAYVPGQTYRLTVNLTRRGMGLAGFQVAVRFADGRAAGTQAGNLLPRDSTTQVSLLATRAVQYLAHTRQGSTLVAPDSARWTFGWDAPAAAEGGAVVFNVAATAANNDASEFGDRIYIRQYRVERKR